jgi:hypothetical protein
MVNSAKFACTEISEVREESFKDSPFECYTHPDTGVCCIYRVAQLTLREGAGSLPALLLD